jgi:hypothetical protein
MMTLLGCSSSNVNVRNGWALKLVRVDLLGVFIELQRIQFPIALYMINRVTDGRRKKELSGVFSSYDMLHHKGVNGFHHDSLMFRKARLFIVNFKLRFHENVARVLFRASTASSLSIFSEVKSRPACCFALVNTLVADRSELFM